MIGIRALERLEYISESDSAIDRVHPDYDWERYYRDGDRKYLPLLDGCEPTIFVLQRLTRRQLLDVVGGTRPDDIEAKAIRAVPWGLVEVRNLAIDGRPVEIHRRRLDAGERVTDESLDKLCIPGLFLELGLRILSMAGLHPTTGQG